MLFFTNPDCDICQRIKPAVIAFAARIDMPLAIYTVEYEGKTVKLYNSRGDFIDQMEADKIPGVPALLHDNHMFLGDDLIEQMQKHMEEK